MQYAILIYQPASDFARQRDPVEGPASYAPWIAYTKALQEAGVMSGGAGLLPPEAATTVRLRGGERIVQDGPYAETKEQLGGFYVIEAPDLDAALVWAARCPAAPSGVIEVRPTMMGPPPPA